MNMNNGYSLEETKELEINSILKNTTNDKYIIIPERNTRNYSR